MGQSATAFGGFEIWPKSPAALRKMAQLILMSVTWYRWRSVPLALVLSGVLDFNSVILQSMATVTEIGSLISRSPEIRGGRPCVAGTGVSVRRIAQWHNMGFIPEEIVRKVGHLSLAQVHAALAYYHANQAEVDADLESEARETDALEKQHRR
jgi:uncharacterized protein (DUF433 family)